MKSLKEKLSIIFSGDKRTATIKKNVLGSFLIRMCSIAVSLLLVPLTLGYVSSELYGVWLTISSIVIWLGFFDVGFSLGLKNKLAEAIALNNWERGKHLVSTTYFMMFIIFIPLCIIMEIAIGFVDWPSFLNIDSKYNDDIVNALRAVLFFFSLNMILKVITHVIAAFQRTAFSSVFPVIGHTIALGVIYILTKTTPPSLTILACTLPGISTIVYLGASLILYNGSFKKIAPHIRYIDKVYIRDLFTLGYKFFILQIQVVVLFQTTNFLISNISSPLDVTAYNLAYKYFSIGMMVYTMILTPLWPAMTDAYTKKDFKWMNNIYVKLQKIFYLFAAATILMIFISPIAYKLWIGIRAEIPLIMSIVVAIYLTLHSLSALQMHTINGVGCVKLETHIAILSMLLHIPLSYFLGGFIGGIGVVVSLIIITLMRIFIFRVQVNKILSNTATGIWAQ